MTTKDSVVRTLFGKVVRYTRGLGIVEDVKAYGRKAGVAAREDGCTHEEAQEVIAAGWRFTKSLLGPKATHLADTYSEAFMESFHKGRA